jgi:hypothetical protein
LSDVDLVVSLSEDRHDTAAGLWTFRRADWNAALSEAVGLDVRLVRITDDDDGGIRAGVEADAVRLYPWTSIQRLA